MHAVSRFVLFLFLLVSALTLTAQTERPSTADRDFPYELDWRREAALLGVGAATSLTAHAIDRTIEPLTADDIQRRGSSDIWGLDRRATVHFDNGWRQASDHLLKGSFLLPSTLLAGRRTRDRALVVGTMLAETMLLNESLTKMVKVTVRRRRPYTYNMDLPLSHKENNSSQQSFISGHTSNTAAACFFTAKVFHDLYPDSKWRPVVWTGAALIPAVTGYARYRAGKHFPTDIIAGYAVGATLGILIPQFHKPSNEPGWSLGPAGEGVGLVVRW